MIDELFRERFWKVGQSHDGDARDPYQIDKARIIHSAAFRRMQGKTQVMGVGEGDFHRTRLTHSLEVAQIGEGLIRQLRSAHTAVPVALKPWLPTEDLVNAACLAHDIGHPPFGHAGEVELNRNMAKFGGFEGNGQTLRILVRLEKRFLNHGIDPTRRLVLSVLKYPIPYSRFNPPLAPEKPPKCYLDTERDVVEWSLEPFNATDKDILITTTNTQGKPAYRTFDCSIMECADDIAYAVHDLEDIVARRFVGEREVRKEFTNHDSKFPEGYKCQNFVEGLFDGGSWGRKAFIGKLVNRFMNSVCIEQQDIRFSHPLLRYRIAMEPQHNNLLEFLKDVTFGFVVKRAPVAQLERRGGRVVSDIYSELLADPKQLVPHESWEASSTTDTNERRVCDYVAGMTDAFAEKVHKRLFIPGFGSSRDEI